MLIEAFLLLFDIIPEIEKNSYIPYLKFLPISGGALINIFSYKIVCLWTIQYERRRQSLNCHEEGFL